MASLSVDWKKFEELANRALSLIADLDRILSENRAHTTSTAQLEFCDHIYTALKIAYAQIKGIALALSRVIQIHEYTKEQTTEIEQKIERDIRDGKENDFRIVISNYIDNYSLETGKEEERIHKLKVRLYRYFISKNYWSRDNEITLIFRIVNPAFGNEDLKRKFVGFLRELANVIEGMYRLLKRDESIEDNILAELEDMRTLLSQDPPSIETDKILMERLEGITRRM